MPTTSASPALRMKRFFASRAHSNRRGTLRDLYTFGLMSVFRRHSILRAWEPLRERRFNVEESANGD